MLRKTVILTFTTALVAGLAVTAASADRRPQVSGTNRLEHTIGASSPGSTPQAMLGKLTFLAAAAPQDRVVLAVGPGRYEDGQGVPLE